ncbi:hypothetical protein KC340_g2038 [Hortaea werneckii]|nr:hypothetical protein KC342_g11163 [Hortaea werneckii]KAI7107622.1 hypothetical protein KC339_g2191 [Hortaea werneckii]KAI7221855.1 hypothetical protein KC365_g11566 [Hortaea werneckii]KAI7335592.1 hypothetical protein KC340_g2038 [Hortaea werneckii]KAI7379990.1 hypothetical protein KC328_g13029 [Hortaea werneckii]
MPTYLLHGFRWPRPLIRIHIILQNLDDAAAEWLVAPETTRTILDNFNELYPESMQHLERLRFVEQYDPSDLSAAAASQPYAYVADVCEEVKLSVPINEVTQRGVPNEQWIALMELKDKIAPEEEVGWFIVVCGDEERYAPPSTDDSGSQTAIAPSSSESSQKEASGGVSSSAKAIADDKQQTKAQAPPVKQPEPRGQPGGVNGKANGVKNSEVNGSRTNGELAMPPVEQKRRIQDLTPPATRTGQRHSMISAVPDLGPPEGVATHWNPNGPGAQEAAQPSVYYPQRRWESKFISKWCEKPSVNYEKFGDVSPITPQYATLGQSRGGGNAAPNSNGLTSGQEAQSPASQHEATLAALQGGQQQDSTNNLAPQPSSMKFRPKSVKDRQRLSLQTQIPPPPPVPEEEEGEAMDEIIAMSPAARQPITSFRKSRSNIALSMVSAGPGNSNSQVNLSGVNLTADTQKPYFGQTINSADLIATGIENAFSRL